MFEKLSLTKEQLQKFETYCELLQQVNQHTNLTTITEKNEIFDKHFFDSLCVLPFLTNGATLLDVGCGAGFPSIPISIMRTDMTVVAVDSTRKKTDFCKMVAQNLNLSNFSVVWDRIETFAVEKNREKFDFVTARAVASTSTLLEYVAPFVKIGGQAILFKTEKEDTFENVASVLGMKYQKTEEFDFDYGKRCLVFFKKVKKTPLKYPRQGNLPRKNPLK